MHRNDSRGRPPSCPLPRRPLSGASVCASHCVEWRADLHSAPDRAVWHTLRAAPRASRSGRCWVRRASLPVPPRWGSVTLCPASLPPWALTFSWGVAAGFRGGGRHVSLPASCSPLGASGLVTTKDPGVLGARLRGLQWLSRFLLTAPRDRTFSWDTTTHASGWGRGHCARLSQGPDRGRARKGAPGCSDSLGSNPAAQRLLGRCGGGGARPRTSTCVPRMRLCLCV